MLFFGYLEFAGAPVDWELLQIGCCRANMHRVSFCIELFSGGYHVVLREHRLCDLFFFLMICYLLGRSVQPVKKCTNDHSLMAGLFYFCCLKPLLSPWDSPANWESLSIFPTYIFITCIRKCQRLMSSLLHFAPNNCPLVSEDEI